MNEDAVPDPAVEQAVARSIVSSHTAADRAGRGSSPYSTGGGGVSFAQRVASIYLAGMLTAERRGEASELPVNRVSFQTGPAHPVDDLLIECGDSSSEVTLAVACRATPNFIKSNKDTVKLVGSLLKEIEKHDSLGHEVAVATAGKSNQWDQLAVLCDIARSHADAKSFQASMDIDGRWSKPLRDRYTQFLGMVELVVEDDPEPSEVKRRTWRLLSRLHILGFAVQAPNELDRTAIATSLDRVASGASDGVLVRDRIETEATRYDATGAVVDLNLLRRDLHGVLDTVETRSRRAWAAIAELRAAAIAAVRTSIGDDASGGPLEIPFAERRNQLVEAMRAAGSQASALVVSGESGIGKSALTLSAVAELEIRQLAECEAVVLNFSNLPQTGVDLRAALGKSLAEVLAELSAPSRVVVLDAADAALEKYAGLLSEIVLAAAAANVGLIAVTSASASGFVRDQVERGFPTPVPVFEITPLTDLEVEVVVDHFPRLRTVLRALPNSSLLRRPIVLDLLARTGAEPDKSLGEWECLELVWEKVVRGVGSTRAGSAEAREQTLLAVAAETINDTTSRRSEARIDAAAVDALRRDHLLAPANLYQDKPQFAHDEVRRWATAILLLRSERPTDLLMGAREPRWALSAATLACKGMLRAPGGQPIPRLGELLSEFQVFATTHGSRWADVPVEAVLDTPYAYECLKAESSGEGAALPLSHIVRVVQQRHVVSGLVDPVAAIPLVRILVDDEEPWNVSKESFALLASWLQALCLADAAAGNVLRIELRTRLLSYWNTKVPREVGGSGKREGKSLGTRRRGGLPYDLTEAKFVEALALLGPEIDNATQACLEALADQAPAYLAPAADSLLSAFALAQKDPELLATLIEAYYIDNEFNWNRHEGVRGHEGRWTGMGAPLFNCYFGGFWALFRSAPFPTSVRVLNRILNSGAKARVETLSKLHTSGVFGAPIDTSAAPSARDGDSQGAELSVDGTARFYYGDSHVWSWYRGTTVGPYPAMSALQAMERLVDSLIGAGVSPSHVAGALLVGCENLAIPGMLFGVLARHLESVGSELDPFLAEPVVWELEFQRSIHENSWPSAPSEGLANVERRQWTAREVAMWLIMMNGDARAKALKTTAEQLIRKGDQLGISQDLTRNWAASLDREQFRTRDVGGDRYVEVELPPEVQAAQQANVAFQDAIQTSMRLQNRYWGSAKHDPEYVPPTSDEIAADLGAAQALLSSDDELMPHRPLDGVAHAVRAAVDKAAGGDLTALGNEAEFATDLLLRIARSFEDAADQQHEDHFFDIGADRAAAQALPALLTPALAGPLEASRNSHQDVARAGSTMARKASLETRLYLARGCDWVWDAPCHEDPCIHRTALSWMLDSARGAEVGPWDLESQHNSYVQIEGNVVERIEVLPADSIDISVLDAAIRGLGSASASDNCCTDDAAALLAAFLAVQARAMVGQVARGWTADSRGTHTLVAGRSLLMAFAVSNDPSPVLKQLDALHVDASLMTNLLHGLAAAGSESPRLAQSAADIWPILLNHAIQYVESDPNPYRDSHWGDWAAAALLPDPLPWTNGLYNELAGPPIDWVKPEDFLDLIDSWLPTAKSGSMPVDALITMLRRLPPDLQATRGIRWVSELCIQHGQVTVIASALSTNWLKEIRTAAEDRGTLDEWQVLVDALVVAGNDGLATFST